MKNIKKLAAISIVSFSVAAFADTNVNDYDADYYEDEGNLLFKIRGFYSVTKSNSSDLPPVAAGAKSPSKLVENGYGFDTSVAFFFTNNVAAELSLGIIRQKTKSVTLQEISAAFGDGTASIGKNNDIYTIPLTATLQYHIAPYGAIRPYIGGGGHFTYNYTRSNLFKIRPGCGPVIQAGIDFISKDDTLFTIDVRQYFLKSKITYKNELLKTGDVTSKTTFNPLLVSVGFGFKF